jgi:hypothetical protein
MPSLLFGICECPLQNSVEIAAPLDVCARLRVLRTNARRLVRHDARVRAPWKPNRTDIVVSGVADRELGAWRFISLLYRTP